MKSNIVIAVWGGILALCVFLGGFVCALYFKHSSSKTSYTQEYIESGRVMLFALRELERGEIVNAKSFLREQVLQTVSKINTSQLPPTPQRDIEQTEQFYKEVNNYLGVYGELSDTLHSSAKLVLDKYSLKDTDASRFD